MGLHKDVIAALVEKVQGIKMDVRSWGLRQVQAKIVKTLINTLQEDLSAL